MANEVFANTREISCKKADGKSICEFPDVCFTPPQTPATPPGVPIPYPNTAFAKDTSSGSKTVKISGQEVMLKNKSFFKTSTGDEAGSAPKKGIITSKTKGKAYFLSWSMDVKFEGNNVVRHLDMTTHNHSSPPANGAVPMAHLDAMAMPAMDGGGSSSSSKDDSCKHDKKKKKGKKYVLYMAEDKDTGKIYIGRTSGDGSTSAKDILKKRVSGHHRKAQLTNFQIVHESESYSAIRGAEQKHIESVQKSGNGVDNPKQINGIGPRNKKKDDYMDCAKAKEEEKAISCAVCTG